MNSQVMTPTKKFLVVIGRLPLLFLIDSILNGTLMNFSSYSVDLNLQDTVAFPLEAAGDAFKSSNATSFFVALLWLTVKSTVILMSLVLVCSPITLLLEVYGCMISAGLLYVSYCCNDNILHKFSLFTKSEAPNASEKAQAVPSPAGASAQAGGIYDDYLLIFMSLLIHLFVVLAFDQICVSVTMTKAARYPTDIVLFCSASLPIAFKAFQGMNSTILNISPYLSVLLPLALWMIHTFLVVSGLVKIIQFGVVFMKTGIRELGIDGLILQFMERTNVAWLLRIFFITKVVQLVGTSEILEDIEEWSNLSWSDIVSILVMLAQNVLFSMCGTILCVMGMASIVSIISGLGLHLVYLMIGAEEEGIQPAVSGFLFVLLAMQTGMTSVPESGRLMLLFQNCVLLFVANQHVVQTVAANLILQASTEEAALAKHLRPMLPYPVFFSFPFTLVRSLWSYPFRVSWLLAISAFSLELLIKSATTILIYIINMIHAHTNYFRENLDDILFYVKAVCGCLEFACGVFLLLNGAYIFLFESGGLIRLVMMIIHCYCNIYQTAVKGWSTYKLRQSAWEKVNKLQPASQEQLDEYDDICPICYQEMAEAVVVKCTHVFHKVCLQKWLSIQETCPLCHKSLTETGPENQSTNNNVPQPVR